MNEAMSLQLDGEEIRLLSELLERRKQMWIETSEWDANTDSLSSCNDGTTYSNDNLRDSLRCKRRGYCISCLRHNVVTEQPLLETGIRPEVWIRCCGVAF